MSDKKEGGALPAPNATVTDRRDFLKATLAVAGTAVLGAPYIGRAANSGTIHVASMFDVTGGLSIYGEPEMNVSRMAVDHINQNGGVLGRKLELHAYDTQSKIELYSRYAQEIGANDDIAVVIGCITGASREAARPILSKNSKLLFFPSVDEGGECDKFTFMQGSDCLQMESPLVNWAVKNAGKTFYVAAADYVYGHVATAWTKSLVEKAGGSIVGTEFIPLDVSDFGATIRKIQTAKPAVIMSNLVGGNHMAFYRQFAAAGLNRSIRIVSPSFGLGNEQQVLSPEETKGIVVAYSYFETLDNAENKAFVAEYRKAHPKSGPLMDLPAQVWNGWHQWKAAVEKAGSTEIGKVVAAMESGIPFQGPSGRIVMDAPSHRNIQDINLATVDDKRQFKILETFKQVPPSRQVVGSESCDLTGKDKDSHRMIMPKM
ncbi:MAG TPA: transporter substrate-binding protein [Burkholderiales bacterium]|nr:transporter substrate-binding protein [Burkholderiales bacterium]